MSGEIIVAEQRPLTVQQVKTGVQVIQQVLADVMKKDVHYGTVPGCGNKPVLLKPGAEKIMATFRIAAVPEVHDLSTGDEARYRVLCKGVGPGGQLLGTGVGECSSSEDKYCWRGAVCDAEFNETPEDRRRAKWKNGKTPYQVKQVRTNPADVANTVLKMAKKRALVDMVLTCTAASDCFEQDLDEMDPLDNEPERTPIRPPQQRQAPPQQDHPPQGEPASSSPARFISEAQRKRLYAIWKGAGKTDEDVKQYLMEIWNVDSTTKVTIDMYDEVCEWAAQK